MKIAQGEKNGPGDISEERTADNDRSVKFFLFYFSLFFSPLNSRILVLSKSFIIAPVYRTHKGRASLVHLEM